MDILKQVRENLGRVKAYYLRNDSVRALNHMILAMKDICRLPSLSTELRGLIREAVQTLGRDENLKPVMKSPLSYTPGQELQLLGALADLYKRYLEEMDREDHATALARKQKIDQNYNQGMKLLEQQQISEADACFAEAVTCYKDEHRLFLLIGKSLMEAGEPRRALPYLKRFSELEPDNADGLRLLQEAVQQRS